ncbi:Kif15 [Symbiodinium necroappetens]|uniref:Kif15 protein n=1 Tax=Symbiodinium necroappetens TaxID=1628268 RepID=A0A812WL60_9DINO|nr:Kif15 [Symbiodinium necroappetens]
MAATSPKRWPPTPVLKSGTSTLRPCWARRRTPTLRLRPRPHRQQMTAVMKSLLGQEEEDDPKLVHDAADMLGSSKAGEELGAAGNAFHDEWEEEEILYLRKRVEELEKKYLEAKMEAERAELRAPCPEVDKLGITLKDVYELEKDVVRKQKEMVVNQEAMHQELEHLSDQASTGFGEGDTAGAPSNESLKASFAGCNMILLQEVMSNQKAMVRNQEGMKEELEKLSEDTSTSLNPSLQEVISMEKEVMSNQKAMVRNQEGMKEELEKLSEEAVETHSREMKWEACDVLDWHKEVMRNQEAMVKNQDSMKEELEKLSEETRTGVAVESGGEAPQQAFKGKELEDEEAEEVSVQTEISGKCFLSEPVAAKFMPVFEGWLLLTSLAKRLKWEELAGVIAKFRNNVGSPTDETLLHAVADVAPDMAKLQSNEAFAWTFGDHLLKASDEVNFTNAQLLKAECPSCLWYIDFINLGLPSALLRSEGQARERLEELEGDLCHGMRKFLVDVQAATGLNRVVRYFGCGKNRVRTEPPVRKGVLENCELTEDPEVHDFMYSMCGNGDISTGKCRLQHGGIQFFSYPCWAVLTGKTGPANQEKQECIAKEEGPAAEQCAEPQAVAFRGQFNRGMADYIYGTPPPLTHSRSREWKKLKGKRGSIDLGWDPDDMLYSLPQNRKLDPPLWEMLREAEVGEGMMMISYGYSGAGKTTTLIGDATAPVGGGRGIDGVLSLYLKENANKIDDVKVKIFEVYGRISAQDGYMKAQTGSGIWGYRLREKTAVYLGQSTAFEEEAPEDEDQPRSGSLNLTLLEEKLDPCAHKSKDEACQDPFTYSIKAESPPSMAGTIPWHEKVKEVLTVIEDIRLDEDQFKAGGEPIAHIRGTVNNPKSSRGTLFVLTNIEFKNGKMAPVSTVDLAGSEDPAVMVSGFLQFKNNENPRGQGLCDPRNGKMPKELMAKYLASLSSWDLMSGPLSWCYKLKDVLVECDPVKPARGCVNIILPSGKKEMVVPKLDKNDKWLEQDDRGVDLDPSFMFPSKKDGLNIAQKKGATFSREDILAAYEQGPVEGLSPKRMETNPFRDDDFDMTWAERLWSRNHKGVGVMDFVLLGSKVNSNSQLGKQRGTVSRYTETAKGQYKGKVDTEIPKTLTRCTGGPKDPNYGKWQDKDDVKNWKKARKMFFEKMKEVIGSQVALDNNNEFIRHLTYFTSAIGPIVEEAFFINEALNDMKGYLGYWAKTSQLSAPGSIINLWPPEELKVKGKDNQIVDYSEGSKISETGYDIFKFLKPKDAEESYAEQLSHGQDGIMLVTMLEFIRRISVRRDKNTKVLVGVFVRSDIPGADLDCDGAKASLQFAQELSDMVGWFAMLSDAEAKWLLYAVLRLSSWPRPMDSIEDQAAISGDEAKFIREENRMLRRQLENHPEVQRMIAENWALRGSEELRALDPAGAGIMSQFRTRIRLLLLRARSKTWFYFQKMAKEVEELMRAKDREPRERAAANGGASQAEFHVKFCVLSNARLGMHTASAVGLTMPNQQCESPAVAQVVELDIATQEALKQAQGLLQGPGCARLPAVTAAGAAGRRGAKEVDDGRSPERGIGPPEQVGTVPCDDEERFKQAVQRIQQLQGTVDLVSAAYGDAFDEFQRLREEYESRLEECQFFELQCSRLNLTCLDLAERLQHDRPVALAECSGETEAKLLYVVLARRDLLAAEVRGQVDVIGHPEIEVILSLQELRELTGADPLPEDLSVLRLRMLACPKFLNKQGLNLVLGRRGQRDARAVKRVSSRLNSVDARASAALQTARPPCSSLCCGFARLFDDRETSTQAYSDCDHLPTMVTEADEVLAGIDFVPSMEAPLENQTDRRALRLEEQPPLAAKQLQANYGIGYALLVNMGYSGGGPTPLCGVKRLARAGLQEDEAIVVDATMKRGVKRRMEQWAKLESQRHGQAEFDAEEGQDAESFEDEELCGLGKALVRELRSTREKKLSIPQLAKKPRVLRVLDLWQVEADFERFLKQFVRDELQSICELVRSSGIAIKKITNKTSRFARACEEAWVVRLKGHKANSEEVAMPRETGPSPAGVAMTGIGPSAEPADSLYPDDWGVDVGTGWLSQPAPEAEPTPAIYGPLRL